MNRIETRLHSDCKNKRFTSLLALRFPIHPLPSNLCLAISIPHLHLHSARIPTHTLSILLRLSQLPSSLLPPKTFSYSLEHDLAVSSTFALFGLLISTLILEPTSFERTPRCHQVKLVIPVLRSRHRSTQHRTRHEIRVHLQRDRERVVTQLDQGKKRGDRSG